MKPIKTTQQFDTHYKQRIVKDDNLRQAFKDSVASFLFDRSSVNDHQLHGEMGLFRAFSMTSDYRVVYMETATHFLFVNVGRHEEVYSW